MKPEDNEGAAKGSNPMSESSPAKKKVTAAHRLGTPMV